jgi:hypothetical protein
MDADLDRLRNDLDVIRTATGLSPAWTPEAVRTHLLLAAAGLCAAVWALVPHGLWPIAGFAAFLVPVADWWWQARARPQRTAAAEREWQDTLATLWFVLPLLALALWSRAVGLDLITMAGLIWFMLGLVLFGPAVGERGMRPLLAWSLAFMVGGLLVPLGVAPIVPIVGAAIGAGALAAAAWIAATLRRAPAA